MKARVINIFLAVVVAGSIIGGVFVLTMLPGLPDSETIRDISLKVPLRVYSSEGQLIAEFGEEKRNPVRIEEAPETLLLAVLASEDDAFYQHKGIDFTGIVRAALRPDPFRCG